MKRHCWLVLTLGLLIAADDPPKEAVDKEVKKLEGTWHTAAFEHNGKTIPEENVKEWTLDIKGDKYTMTIGNNSEEGTFKIDPAKKPATVDVTPTEGPSKGKTRKGIYQREGDEAKVCFAAIGTDERPTDFASPEGSKNYLWTFKRDKK
jgi:uncharacterized protein (TIGR03067 family)